MDYFLLIFSLEAKILCQLMLEHIDRTELIKSVIFSEKLYKFAKFLNSQTYNKVFNSYNIPLYITIKTY